MRRWVVGPCAGRGGRSGAGAPGRADVTREAVQRRARRPHVVEVDRGLGRGREQEVWVWPGVPQQVVDGRAVRVGDAEAAVALSSASVGDPDAPIPQITTIRSYRS